MSLERLRSFALLLGTNILSKAAWALALVVLLRTLGPADFGLLATLWSLATLGASLTDLGTGQVLLREGVRQPGIARLMALRVLCLQAALSLLLGLGLGLLALTWFDTPRLSGAARLFVIGASIATPFCDRFQNLFTVFSQLRGHYRIYAGLRSAYFLAVLLGFALIAGLSPSLVGFSGVFLACTLIAALAMARGTWELLPRREAGQLPGLRAQIRWGLPFLCISLLTLAYGRAEVIVLGFLGHAALAGAFHAVYQLVQLFYSLSGILFTVTYPRLYRHRGETGLLDADYRDTVRWLALLAWASAPPLAFYADPIMQLIGAQGLRPYADLVRMMSLFMLLIPATAALNFLLPMDQLGKRVLCDLLGVGVSLLGLAIVLSLGRPEWVGLSSVLGYAAALLAAIRTIRRSTRIHASQAWRELMSVALRAIPAALLVFMLPLPWWLGIGIYLLLFLALLWITGHPAIPRLRRWLQPGPEHGEVRR